MLENDGQSIWSKKDFFLWAVSPVQEIAPPDFLLMVTAYGRQHSCGEVFLLVPMILGKLQTSLCLLLGCHHSPVLTYIMCFPLFCETLGPAT